ncbi:hypothetical protein KSC_107440 [Ktedonobacter sp. SOSP1-52]|nr:hypothetical protein KSC_107440 [Ktedonobacter sp. SOSP1-52]
MPCGVNGYAEASEVLDCAGDLKRVEEWIRDVVMCWRENWAGSLDVGGRMLLEMKKLDWY